MDRERFEATASLIRRTVNETSNEAATEMICHLLYDGVIKEILAQVQFGGDDAIRVAVKSNVLSSVLEFVEKYCASEQTEVPDSKRLECVSVVTMFGHICTSRVAASAMWKHIPTFLRILSRNRASSPSHSKAVYEIRKSICVAMRNLLRNSREAKKLNDFMSKMLSMLRRNSHELNSKSTITKLGVESEMACMMLIVDLVESNYETCYDSFLKDAGFEHLMFIGIKGLGHLDVSMNGVLKCLYRLLLLPRKGKNDRIVRNTNALNVLFTLTTHYFTPTQTATPIISQVRTQIVSTMIEILCDSPTNFENTEQLLVSAKIGSSIFETIVKSLRQIHRPFNLVRMIIKMFQFVFTQQQNRQIPRENLLREIGNLLVVLCTCSSDECNGDHTNVANEIFRNLVVRTVLTATH